MKKPKHILVVRLSALGDVAMVVPVLQRLVKTYPELKITILTKAFFAPLFFGIPNVSVVVAEVKGKHKGIPGLKLLADELAAKNIDAVADLHNVLRSNILNLFFGLKRIPVKQIDKGRAEKKQLVRLDAHKVIKPLKTTHERYAEVFQKLGFPIDLDLKIPHKKRPFPEQILKVIDGLDKKFLGIAPFAAHEAKMYPLELMEEVIATLSENKNYRIFLFGGGKKEKEMADKLLSKIPGIFSVIGKLTFEEQLALISNLDLMLSMDSGNGHLAAVFGVPVVTLWGGTHPFAGFAPFGQPVENQFLPNLEKYPMLPTSIYGKKHVKEYEDVMRSISPMEVVKRLEGII